MTANNSVELFWAMVDRRAPDECWVWTGYCTIKGYGRTFWEGRNRGTHRIAYSLVYGQIGDGMNVLHRCDNPPCCNPSHLFTGTQLENNVDKKIKGRSYRPTAERNPKAKLTWEDVREIRRLYQIGTPRIELARMYGITTVSIGDIVNYNHWKE